MTKQQLWIVGKYFGAFAMYMLLTVGMKYLYDQTEDFFFVVLGAACFFTAWFNFLAGAVRAQMMLNNEDETSEG